jgi:hypothetical protein
MTNECCEMCTRSILYTLPHKSVEHMQYSSLDITVHMNVGKYRRGVRYETLQPLPSALLALPARISTCHSLLQAGYLLGLLRNVTELLRYHTGDYEEYYLAYDTM